VIEQLPGELILRFPIRVEPDIVTCRQKTRKISRELGFDGQDQVRIATAVSELTRNVYQYAGKGEIAFFFSLEENQTLFIRVSDNGTGIHDIDSILAGTYSSKTGMGVGLVGTKKLMDFFEVETAPGRGTTVTIGKKLEPRGQLITSQEVAAIAMQMVSISASNPFEELQNQNRDLLNALEEVRAGKENLTDLNRELAETNRGVVALYAELDEKAAILERINEELTRAREGAELASHAKSRFLSNMSHEIRTPLGVILGFADLAMEADITKKVRDDFLQTIRRNAQSLTKLIGEILDLSKIEAGQIDIEYARFSLPLLISEVITALELQAKVKGISLTFKFSGPYPEFVMSDAMRVRQILFNVINNALKFTNVGGVTISAQLRERGDETKPAFMDFFVTDTGIGMSPDQQSRLFQAFMQADNSTTRKFGGTGLGLNLSKKLAQSLGGDLLLERSDSEIGSTFKFSFNAGLVSSLELNQHIQIRELTKLRTRGISDELKGLKVLLVEDSVDNQNLFSRYLSRAGAEVDIACDGVEGLGLARDQIYDVILMDVQMPNLDGYGATSILRSEGCMTPIIALTAHALHEDREIALTKGFSRYLTKPLNADLLVQTIDEVTKELKANH
jgi:signal transduction histidine kinase/ActR/RegA family two-component response regulator